MCAPLAARAGTRIMRVRRPWPCQRESVGQRKRCLEQRERGHGGIPTAKWRTVSSFDPTDFVAVLQAIVDVTIFRTIGVSPGRALVQPATPTANP